MEMGGNYNVQLWAIILHNLFFMHKIYELDEKKRKICLFFIYFESNLLLFLFGYVWFWEEVCG